MVCYLFIFIYLLYQLRSQKAMVQAGMGEDVTLKPKMRGA